MTIRHNRLAFIALIGLVFSAPFAAGQAAGQAVTVPSVDAAAKRAIVDEVCSLLNESYVFPETAKKIEEALRSQIKDGKFDEITAADAFARAVAGTLALVGKDRHMGLAFNPAAAEDMRRLAGRSEEDARRVRERRQQAMRDDNYGFRKVERMAGNIGYLDFRVFHSPDDAGPTAVAALNFLAHCDAIIVDLRQNGGGEPAMIQLISSYFFSEPVHLNDIYDRTTNQTDYYYTLPYVPGPRPVGADLYILTSARSFSGAEEFAYNMKNLKRATILGETTGGGAHPTTARIVQKDFILRIPFARSINPISKTNWEGTGVAPDIACPAAEAFDRAYALAAEKLAAKAANPEKKAAYQALNEWIRVGMKAKAEPPRVEAGRLGIYAGEYGDRKVSLEGGVLYYQRTGPKSRLIPLSETLFAPEGVDGFRVEFTIKDGRAVELVGLYDTGMRQSSPRTK